MSRPESTPETLVADIDETCKNCRIISAATVEPRLVRYKRRHGRNALVDCAHGNTRVLGALASTGRGWVLAAGLRVFDSVDDLLKQDDAGHTPIYHAVRSKSLQCVLNLTQRAEEYGPEILEAMMSQWSQLSRTLVDVAIGTGETSIVDAVLNAYKRTGRPVLPQILFEIAIENGAITRTVLKHIVDKYKPDLRGSGHRRAPVFDVLEKPSLLRVLVQECGMPTTGIHRGKTPLHVAIVTSNVSAVRILTSAPKTRLRRTNLRGTDSVHNRHPDAIVLADVLDWCLDHHRATDGKFETDAGLTIFKLLLGGQQQMPHGGAALWRAVADDNAEAVRLILDNADRLQLHGVNNDARTFVAWAGNLYAHDEHPTSVLELAIRRDAVHVLERIRFPETVRRQHVYVSACSFKVRHWIAMPGTYRNTRNYRTMLYAATVAGPTKFNEHDLPSPWHRLDANMHLDRTDQWYLVKQTMEDLHTGIERARVFGAQMFIKMWRRETPTYDDATRILCRRALKGLKPATRSPQLDLKANQLYTFSQTQRWTPRVHWGCSPAQRERIKTVMLVWYRAWRSRTIGKLPELPVEMYLYLLSFLSYA